MCTVPFRLPKQQANRRACNFLEGTLGVAFTVSLRNSSAVKREPSLYNILKSTQTGEKKAIFWCHIQDEEPHNNQLVHYEDTHRALDTYIIIAQKRLDEQKVEILGSESFTRRLGRESARVNESTEAWEQFFSFTTASESKRFK